MRRVHAKIFSSALPSPAKAKEGKYFFDDGSVYEGTLAMGKPDGFGKRIYGNSDVYEGQFRKGLEHGSGTLRFKSDEQIDRYVGMWASGQMEGFGALVFADDSRMEGEWKNGTLRFGELQGANGEIKSGRWEGNTLPEMFLKEGRVRLPNGDDFSGVLDYDGKYRYGSLKSWQMETFLLELFPLEYLKEEEFWRKQMGSLYVGQFSAGLYSGTGLMIEEDGESYSGEFSNGLPEDMVFRKVLPVFDTPVHGWQGKEREWVQLILVMVLLLLGSFAMDLLMMVNMIGVMEEKPNHIKMRMEYGEIVESWK